MEYRWRFMPSKPEDSNTAPHFSDKGPLPFLFQCTGQRLDRLELKGQDFLLQEKKSFVKKKTCKEKNVSISRKKF